MARAGLALLGANVRYWPTVAPATGRELAGWEACAREIPDANLRSLALSKLSEEHFNAQVSTTLVTLLEPLARPRAVRALVALELAYDYLDGLTELPAEDPLGSSLALFASFTGALDPSASVQSDPDRDPSPASAADDGGYLSALAAAVRSQLASLPSWALLAPVPQAAAQRTAQAQSRLHAASVLGDDQLRDWASPLAARAGLGWREFLAGAAASVLACHALIVAAADPATTTADAERLDAFYLRLCALSTLLDALVDRERDLAAGAQSLLRFYPDPGGLSDAVCSLARDACARAEELPDGPHHLMVMVGVVSYYLSAPGARDDFAMPVRRTLRSELSPLIFATLAVMRVWRAAKALGALRPGAGSAR